ncbi:MAG: polysaccharide deacetylase family protein [Akkermansia sp.]|nr:polysaccharide deacetylase family protein [Akkermansia sp.]
MRKFSQYTCILAAMMMFAACSQNQHTANVIRPADMLGPAETAEPVVQNEELTRPKPETPSKVAKITTPAAPPATIHREAPLTSEGAAAVETQAPRKFQPKKPGIRVSQVNVPGMYVALTFDDGPSSAYTPAILDILQRHGARATFFVVGRNAARYPGILARAVAEGHEVANHTYTHIKMTASGKQTIAREIERTNEAIKAATGYYPTAMRPPYGATNASLVEMVSRNYGMHSVLWDVDTRDWQRPGVDKVVERAVGKARPGSIILLHDIHASTLEAVESIVTGLQARGFKLVTVSQLVEMGRRAAEPAAEPLPATEGVAPEALPTEATPGGEGAAEIVALPAAVEQ